jgi:uncharacterized protein
MSDTPQTQPGNSNVIVTLRAGGIFFAAANVICVGIICWAYLSVKFEPKTMNVTGSARKSITSDRIHWSGRIMVKDPDLKIAFDKLSKSADLVVSYIESGGLPKDEITLSSIATDRRYKQKVLFQPAQGSNAQPIITNTDEVEVYTLTQTISVDSCDMTKVAMIARNVTSLIKDGVEIDSYSPSYLYTKLSELKIDMIAEATKDATQRAEQIVNNANGKLGKLVEARLGVMQINPKGVTATSAEGNNDTTSYEKDIISVVNVRFEVR